MLADGLAGGRANALVESLGLRQSRGSIWETATPSD